MGISIEKLLQTIPYWPLVTLLIVLCVSIFFRKELAELIGKLQEFEFDPRNRKFRLIFNQEIKHAKAQAQGVGKEVTENITLPGHERVADFSKESSRDIVLQSWAALKQCVYDGCVANNFPLTPTTSIKEALRRLGEAKFIKSEVDVITGLLNKLGEQLADDRRLKPSATDARQYMELANDVIDWMMLNLIARGSAKGERRLGAAVHRPTVVADYFPQPQAARPAAALDGTAGAVRGQRFLIEKEHFRIGRDADNDVRISGDEFVSGQHASLRYQSGGLLLTDHGSRNGTFVNDKRMSDTPVGVRAGDRIRIGNAVFQVSGAPTSPAVNALRDKGQKQSETVG